MGLFKFLGVLSPAHIGLVTLLKRPRKVGIDQLEIVLGLVGLRIARRLEEPERRDAHPGPLTSRALKRGERPGGALRLVHLAPD